MIVPVILCGGSGTRLWPLSRELYPKQLLALTGNHTLLQQTALRLAGVAGVGEPVVICNEEHRFLVAEQLRQVQVVPRAIVLEPIGRNTAPAVALAALHQEAAGADSLLLILPADHIIQDGAAFQRAVMAGAEVARQGRLVTFGIVPERAETGYGYIKRGASLAGDNLEASFFAIEEFVEKPDATTAAAYCQDGGYSWNSGMFMFAARLYLQELARFEPAMAKCCREAYAQASSDLDFTRIGRQSFTACPNDSIDYAVMEKTTLGAVLPISVGWNDIGSWAALWEIGSQDQNGNVVHGDVMLYDSTNSFLHSSGRLVAAIGIDGLVVVETDDAVLVASKDRVQEVKQIVTRLRAEGRQEANLHRRVFRPWGSYEGIMVGERFQVKLITVNAGAILSLQMHHHRAEHWVVVKGTAKITKGTESFLLTENESTYIPLGVTHRLENPGVIPLELIEVQSGSYLGEDDITRLEDSYGRVEVAS